MLLCDRVPHLWSATEVVQPSEVADHQQKWVIRLQRSRPEHRRKCQHFRQVTLFAILALTWLTLCTFKFLRYGADMFVLVQLHGPLQHLFLPHRCLVCSEVAPYWAWAAVHDDSCCFATCCSHSLIPCPSVSKASSQHSSHQGFTSVLENPAAVPG